MGLFHVAGLTLDLPTPQARAIGRLDGALGVGDRLVEDGTDKPVGEVRGITAYGRPLKALSTGMTAELRLTLAEGALPLAVPAAWRVVPGGAGGRRRR